jgi:hypothetical protein
MDPLDAFDDHMTDSRADAREAAHDPTNNPFIEFWVWHDDELLPATPAELEWIHEREREREARWRLPLWQSPEWQSQPYSSRWQRLPRVLAALARGVTTWRDRFWHHPGSVRAHHQQHVSLSLGSREASGREGQ